MVRKFGILLPLLACSLAAACNPFSLKNAIVGRWESTTWRYSKEYIYADFQSDGTLTFLTSWGTHEGKWKILDDGQLKVTFSSGSSKTCKASVSGSTLTIKPPACMTWQELGPSVTLEKH
jgi:hypothetical protein